MLPVFFGDAADRRRKYELRMEDLSLLFRDKIGLFALTDAKVVPLKKTCQDNCETFCDIYDLRHGFIEEIGNTFTGYLVFRFRMLFSELFGVMFRAIWRVGASTQREPDRSRHEYGGYSQVESNVYPIVGATLGSRERTLVLPRRSSGLSGMPNSSQTLRHIAIKGTSLLPHP
jgi:hypothetical protein